MEWKYMIKEEVNSDLLAARWKRKVCTGEEQKEQGPA